MLSCSAKPTSRAPISLTCAASLVAYRSRIVVPPTTLLPGQQQTILRSTTSFVFTSCKCTHAHAHARMHMHLLDVTNQAKVVIKPLKFADACAYPSAKPITVYGATGPLNAVDVNGTLFIENVEAEAAAEALHSKALESASEVAPVASEEVAAEVAPAPKPTPEPAAALDSEPSCSVATSSAILYSAAASKPPVMPKPSAATFQMRSAASS